MPITVPVAEKRRGTQKQVMVSSYFSDNEGEGGAIRNLKTGFMFNKTKNQKVVYLPSTDRKKQEFFNSYGDESRRRTRNDRRLLRKIGRQNYESGYKLKQAKNSLYTRQLKHRATKAELEFREYLISKKVRLPFHRILDFYIPGAGIGFEIDGGYHKAREQLDRYNDQRYLYSRGIQIYRFTNEQVFDGSFKPEADLILFKTLGVI